MRAIDTRIRLDPGGDVYNARALLSSSPLVLGSAGTFQLNYDKESSLRSSILAVPINKNGKLIALSLFLIHCSFIAQNSHYEYLSLAEFVSKSIDNLSSGLLVRDGMKYLGLKECVSLVMSEPFLSCPRYTRN